MKEKMSYLIRFNGRVTRINYLVFGNIFLISFLVISVASLFSFSYSIPFFDVSAALITELKFVMFGIGESGQAESILNSSLVYTNSYQNKYMMTSILIILLIVFFSVSTVSFMVRRVRDIRPSISRLQICFLMIFMLLPYLRDIIYIGLILLSESMLVKVVGFLRWKK